jgi:hypothetical protein
VADVSCAQLVLLAPLFELLVEALEVELLPEPQPASAMSEARAATPMVA